MQFLSHITSEDDPGYPGNPRLKVVPFSQIHSGDVANTYNIELFNHFGTHMDSPKHFNDNGVPLISLPAEAFVFHHPYLLDQPLDENELLSEKHLRRHNLAQMDCLLIRSGFEQYRNVDPAKYAGRGPGIGSDAARYLIEQCPVLRVIVIDWISITAYRYLDEGYLAHRILSGAMGHERFILGVEDASLGTLPTSPSVVIALPLRIQKTDGGPCTILAW